MHAQQSTLAVARLGVTSEVVSVSMLSSIQQARQPISHDHLSSSMHYTGRGHQGVAVLTRGGGISVGEYAALQGHLRFLLLPGLQGRLHLLS